MQSQIFVTQFSLVTLIKNNLFDNLLTKSIKNI